LVAIKPAQRPFPRRFSKPLVFFVAASRFS